MKYYLLTISLSFFLISCTQESTKLNLESIEEPSSIISSYNNEKSIDLDDYPILKQANDYLNQRDFKKMLEKLDEAERNYGRMRYIYNERGLCLAQLGIYEEALTCFDSIIINDENAFSAYANRAQVYYRLYKPDLAIADQNKAIEIDPSNSAIYFNKGLALLYKQERDEACINFNKALELGYAEDYSTEIYTVLENECKNKLK